MESEESVTNENSEIALPHSMDIAVRKETALVAKTMSGVKSSRKNVTQERDEMFTESMVEYEHMNDTWSWISSLGSVKHAAYTKYVWR